MALLSLVTDLEDEDVFLAIAADDDGAEYVWPKGAEPWFDGDRRLAGMLDFIDDGDEPTDALGWLSLAGAGLGRTALSEPVEFSTIEEAAAEGAKRLEAVPVAKGEEKSDLLPGQDSDPTGVLAASSDAFDDISQDYPGFGESDDPDTGEDSQAMLNFLMSTLGPIDPDGPNGWIIRAADGEPQDGDDQLPIHFPGTPLPETKTPAEDAAEPSEEPDE